MLTAGRALAAGLLLVIIGCGGDDPRPAPRAVASSSAAPSTTTTTTTTTAPAETTSPSTTTTTSATEPQVAAPDGLVIVIDPGHNEHNYQHPDEINRQVDIGNGQKACDTTGTATDDGYSEAAFTTDVANRVAALLRDQGATVILTRDPSTPWGPCINERAGIGNDAHADAAISIHADGASSDAHGFHVIRPLPVSGYNEAIVEPSERLALEVRDDYQAATGLSYSTYAGHDGIDARDDLGGLNLSTVPKVFIECGNMRNAGDAAGLDDPQFRERIAEGIAAGVFRFVAR